jgi:hypothetical protein
MGAMDLATARLVKLGSAKLSVATAATTAFDFGTPNDINLSALTGAPGFGYRAGDRLLVVVESSTGGTTNAISISVQDAPDNAGSIGTPAAATTDGTLTGGTGDQSFVCMVLVKANRPWIRVNATGVGTTDTHTLKCSVYAVPRSGL